MKACLFKYVPENAEVHDTWYRHDVLNLLEGDQLTGIELGVAEGVFSDRMVKSGRFLTFFGVDMYADMHDVNQYKRALKRVGLLGPYKLLRMRFDQAIDLFDDESFDFIYVDGYAHTGEEGGETIFNWFRKLKIGGVLAGDDYSDEWPLVISAVNEFARQTKLKLHITGRIEESTEYCQFPSWAVVKQRSMTVMALPEMVSKGKQEAERIARIRNAKPLTRHIRRLAKRIIPDPIVQMIRKNKG